MSIKRQRKVIVQLENNSYEGLRVDFDIKKTISGEPNTASIRVYNLSRSTLQGLIANYRDMRIRLLAGYGEEASLLFEGLITYDGLATEDNGIDRIVSLSAQTGIKTYQSTRINQSFRAGTSYRQILQALATTSGFPQPRIAVYQNLERRIQNAVTFSGPVSSYFNQLADALRSDWSIQDNELRIIGKGESTPEKGPRYSPELNNIIGSPKTTDIGATVKVFLDPIKPGDRFQVDGVIDQRLAGQYRADAVQYVGSQWADEYYSVIEGRRLQT